MKIKTSNIGYPTIGDQRELKFLMERFWQNKITETELESQAAALRQKNLAKQSGLDLIPIGDFSFYDRMLDQTILFNLIPERFKNIKNSYRLYFAMARGKDPLEMSKWFNTNYHYLIPELGAAPSPSLNQEFLDKTLSRYNSLFDEKHKLALIGPYTFIKLSKGCRDTKKWFTALSKTYISFISKLKQKGLIYLQLEEPCLVGEITTEEFKLLSAFLEKLADLGIKVILQSYFEHVPGIEKFYKLPCYGLGFDFVSNEQNLVNLKAGSFPKDKVLFAGVINGRNIWKTDLSKTLSLVKELSKITGGEEMFIQPSCSLLHVPVNAAQEDQLPALLKDQLAFADEKLTELKTLPAIFSGQAVEKVERSNKDAANKEKVRARIKTLTEADFKRSTPFIKRKTKQQEKLKLPLLPTTTIGSFPQTAEIRKTRRSFKNDEINAKEYKIFINSEIEALIKFQEEIELDVLVHGEFERTDMVEFFGEKLSGFARTINGWVQSYGSRCVKPPIIWADIERERPMTVEETRYAQSLTKKPVKGMLTGPITILNWSFVREDIPRKDVANQIALALRDETSDLEQAGISIIQIDEPALKEGEPLAKEKIKYYYAWAVAAFKLASSGIKDETQLHTHMCYSEFNDIIDHIAAMDADVISIENARSKGELLEVFKKFDYKNDIGPGVYDIHSPYVPTVEEIKKKIKENLKYLKPEQLWINPDCGLKTRREEEIIPALKNMVAAAKEARMVI